MTVGEWLRKHGRKTANGVKPVCYFVTAICVAAIAITFLCLACQSHPVAACVVATIIGFVGLCHLVGDLPGDEYRRR